MRNAVTNTPAMDFFVHHLAAENHYLLNGTNLDSYGYVVVSNVFHSSE
jgi:hypothetical protein